MNVGIRLTLYRPAIEDHHFSLSQWKGEMEWVDSLFLYCVNLFSYEKSFLYLSSLKHVNRILSSNQALPGDNSNPSIFLGFLLSKPRTNWNVSSCCLYNNRLVFCLYLNVFLCQYRISRRPLALTCYEVLKGDNKSYFLWKSSRLKEPAGVIDGNNGRGEVLVVIDKHLGLSSYRCIHH